MLLSEVQKDPTERTVFFFHFLMVASTLLCLSSSDEDGYRLEDLVHPPHVLVNEVRAIDLEEPMVLLIFLLGPVSRFHVGVLAVSLTVPSLFGLSL